MAEGRHGFPVEPDGWYVEEKFCTSFLAEREDLTAGVYDPACGGGNIVTTCLELGIDAVGSDLRDRVSIRRRGGRETPAWFLGKRDFLQPPFPRAPRPIIVMNPPYGRALLAEAFIREALRTAGVTHVHAFVNAKFLFSDGRAKGLYAEVPPGRVYPISPRPSCPPGQFLRAGGKAEGGVENFVWMVWDLAAPTGRTEFIWR